MMYLFDEVNIFGVPGTIVGLEVPVAVYDDETGRVSRREKGAAVKFNIDDKEYVMNFPYHRLHNFVI